jgi:pyruvate dehydrogenase E2 component (dihydrolipoamide acetyltransferase)
MTTFHLPDLGEGLQEAEIVAWHVGVGDHVVADQPLVSVETEKAVVEIPAPHSGRIAEFLVAVGDVVSVGAPLVAFNGAAKVDAGTVVGDVRSAMSPTRAVLAPSDGKSSGIKAAPAVRRLADRLGVDLAAVESSGPDGTISKADVERASELIDRLGPLESLRGVRRAMARTMQKAHAEVVPATVTDEAGLSAWSPNTDVTLRLIRAVVAGCRAEPALNAWFFGVDKGRRLHDHVDLGLAMDTAEGLFVPVLRNAGARDPEDLRRGLEAMKADVRDRRVPLKELRGQTITLSNFGMYGGRHAALVVVPPQVAILGAGRIQEQVVVLTGTPEVAPVLPLSLTFDHRVVMGGEASRFLTAVIADLETAD